MQWARDIRAVYKLTVKQTVQGVFKLGRMLIAAKASLDHGEFEKMIERNLPFDASTGTTPDEDRPRCSAAKSCEFAAFTDGMEHVV